MRATSAVPTLTCGRATSTALGAGVSLTIPNGRVLTTFVGDQNGMQPHMNDHGGTSRILNVPHGQIAGLADQPETAVTMPCDGVNMFLKNSGGVANDVAYLYWSFA